jgi:GT2 family glycosyltransferase
MWDCGWEVKYVPTVNIVHHGGGSSSNEPIKFYIEQQKANLQYWKKHKTNKELFAFIGITIIHHLLRIIVYSVRNIIKCDTNNANRYKVKRSYLVLKELKKIFKE